MKDASKCINAIAEQENMGELDAIRKHGRAEVHVPMAAEKAEWRRALMPVRKDVEGRVGNVVLNAVNKESAAMGVK